MLFGECSKNRRKKCEDYSSAYSSRSASPNNRMLRIEDQRPLKAVLEKRRSPTPPRSPELHSFHQKPRLQRNSPPRSPEPQRRRSRSESKDYTRAQPPGSPRRSSEHSEQTNKGDCDTQAGWESREGCYSKRRTVTPDARRPSPRRRRASASPPRSQSFIPRRQRDVETSADPAQKESSNNPTASTNKGKKIHGLWKRTNKGMFSKFCRGEVVLSHHTARIWEI